MAKQSSFKAGVECVRESNRSLASYKVQDHLSAIPYWSSFTITLFERCWFTKCYSVYL